MVEEINYIELAPVASSLIQIVSNFTITTESDNKTPKWCVLNIVIDGEKAHTDVLEFPVFIPAKEVLKGIECQRLKREFESDSPFCAVRCDNLHVYRKIENNVTYYGFADYFTVVFDPSLFFEEEELL